MPNYNQWSEQLASVYMPGYLYKQGHHGRVRAPRKNAKANVFLKSEEMIDQAINIAIADRFVRIVDRDAITVINSLLNRYYNLSLDKLTEEPEKVAKALFELCGPGADTIVKIMLAAAYRAFGIEPDSTVFDCDHKYLKAGLERLKKIVKERTQAS